jgi:hypothetical protein
MTACPPTDRLEALLEECLDFPAQQELEAHIDGCAFCQATLETLTQLPESLRELLRNVCDLAVRKRENGSGTSDSFFVCLKRVAGGVRDPRAGTPAQPPVIAATEVPSEAGRDGCSVVYRPRQVGLNRVVPLERNPIQEEFPKRLR